MLRLVGYGVPIPYLLKYSDMIKDTILTENNRTHWENKICGLCKINFVKEDKVGVIKCGHIFHHLCLKKHIDKHGIICPFNLT